MNKLVYAIRDNKMGSFDKPVLLENDKVAKRAFGDLVCRDGDNVYAMHPADFTIYRLGEFDSEHGTMTNLDCPLAIATGSDYVVTKKKGKGKK